MRRWAAYNIKKRRTCWGAPFFLQTNLGNQLPACILLGIHGLVAGGC